MCLDTLTNGSRPVTSYPATVHLDQVGSTNVVLQMSPEAVTFASADDDGKCVDIAVSVPDSVASDPAFQADSTELAANLQISAPGGTHLDTVTTVKVHLTLVHPTACIRALHFVLNQDFTSNLGANGVRLSINRANRNLNMSPVDAQHLLALVNTCGQSLNVDVATAINDNFELFQANAVRTTNLNQELADETELLGSGLDWDAMGNITPPAMCLQNVAVPANQTLVLAQRVRIRSAGNFPGIYAASIGRATTGWSYEGFSYQTHIAGTACAGGLSGDVLPNSGDVALPVNQVSVSGQGAPVVEYAP
jgi:hypothetical protein